MPQFHLNRSPSQAELNRAVPWGGKPGRKAHGFHDLDDFAQGYVEAMFFTNGDMALDDDDDTLNRLGTGRLTNQSLRNIEATCAEFYGYVKTLLALVPAYDAQQAGSVFWFERQGHGVGFADREEFQVPFYGESVGDQNPSLQGLPENCQGEIHERLSAAAQKRGECFVEVHRGWIHVGP